MNVSSSVVHEAFFPSSPAVQAQVRSCDAMPTAFFVFLHEVGTRVSKEQVWESCLPARAEIGKGIGSDVDVGREG